jgi:hypothetical protein
MKRALLAGLVWVTMAVAAAAMSGTDPLVGEYDPIEERLGWPKGVLELLQDPTRKVGWKSWFSGLQNDVENYAFSVRTTSDAQRLIDAFAKIDDRKKRVAFLPGRGPRGLGDFRLNAKGREWGAVLSVSNRDAVARANAEDVRAGKPAVYMASPTVLSIHLGTADVRLEELRIPKDLTLSVAESSPAQGKAYPEQVRQIQAFKAKWFRK